MAIRKRSRLGGQTSRKASGNAVRIRVEIRGEPREWGTAEEQARLLARMQSDGPIAMWPLSAWPGFAPNRRLLNRPGFCYAADRLPLPTLPAHDVLQRVPPAHFGLGGVCLRRIAEG